jgi:hypothetical protein
MPDKILENVDEHRRGFLKRLVGGGFAAPLIAAFSLESLMTTSSALAMANTTSNTNDDLFLDFFDDGHGH